MLNEGPKKPTPQEFADSAAQTDGYEIAAARAALAQSRHPRVRAFAEQMLAEHETTGRTLREATKGSGLEAPDARVGGDDARFLAGLQSLRGEAFDREYGRQQVLTHVKAVAVMRSYAAKGSDANLRRWAATTVTMIEGHLQTARQLPQPAS